MASNTLFKALSERPVALFRQRPGARTDEDPGLRAGIGAAVKSERWEEPDSFSSPQVTVGLKRDVSSRRDSRSVFQHITVSFTSTSDRGGIGGCRGTCREVHAAAFKVHPLTAGPPGPGGRRACLREGACGRVSALVQEGTVASPEAPGPGAGLRDAASRSGSRSVFLRTSRVRLHRPGGRTQSGAGATTAAT